jgi:release factor glutamine methyltransferase
MTVRDVLNEGRALLSSHHIDTPALDAGLLLAEILHTDRAGLIIKGNDAAAGDDVAAYRRLLERRLSGECAAYILGRKEFRGLEFTVTPDVLVPRPDTETLVEAALEVLGVPGPAGVPSAADKSRVLDLCTGSGAVAVSLKNERPDLELWASDISKKALALARTNGEKLLGFSKTGSAGTIHFVESDLFEKFETGAIFNLIVSNPPYVPSAEIEKLAPEVRREPKLALDGGEDGLGLIRRIIAEAGAFLAPGGFLLMEADPRQMTAIRALLNGAGWTDIKTWRDLSGRERVTGGRPGSGAGGGAVQ